MMPNVVQIQFNPYLPRLSILIDGKPLSEYSQLVQYSDEDIWQWGPNFLDALYSELRNDFYITFIGTEQDAQVLRCLCAKHHHCKGFQAKDFPIAAPLQARMKDLNQFIKAEAISTFQKSIIDAVFLFPASMQVFREDISTLDINNLFCSVRIYTFGVQNQYKEQENSVFFLLTDETNTGLDAVDQYELHRPVFVIKVGAESGLIEVTDSYWLYATTEDQLFETIFTCFFNMPLLLAFRSCIQSLSGSNSSQRLRRISCVEPIVNISVANQIEVGKSAKITVSLDPPNGKPPDLVYQVRNKKVASCDGLCVFGLQKGASVLEVYRNGEKNPFFVQDIEVSLRNRIVAIVLSDDALLLGLNDRKSLSCDYSPNDADNTGEITWRSSNSTVVKVDGRGHLIAAGLGQCRIICTAENVSAQCHCTVKPYLSRISVDLPIEEDALRLEPMAEYELPIETSPKDCIDDKIVVETSDYNIINVVNYTLYAKNCGNAVITVRNINGRISRTFSVVVAKKKVGFFKKLFGNR